VRRRPLAALVVGAFWTIALGTACDSRPRQREPLGHMTAVPVQPASAAQAAPVPARVAAIGYTAPLAPELQRAFDDTAFEPMAQPGPDDWLSRHAEKPQSFQDYLSRRRCAARRPFCNALPRVGFVVPRIRGQAIGKFS
jgi:hypothetical protein